MGACGGKPEQQPKTNHEQNGQQVPSTEPMNLQKQQPHLPEDAKTVKQKFEFLIGHQITDYFVSKSPNYENYFKDNLVPKLNFKPDELAEYIKLVTVILQYHDGMFDHVKKLHKEIQELLQHELTDIFKHQKYWEETDINLIIVSILVSIYIKQQFFIQVYHIKISLEKNHDKWWKGDFFKGLHNYLTQTHQIVIQESTHDDLGEANFIVGNLKQIFIRRTIYLTEEEIRIQKEIKKKQIEELLNSKDAVIQQQNDHGHDLQLLQTLKQPQALAGKR
ncbi:hypothetical protein pb186bvf_017563 [Paramecium bursaria]